MKSGHYGVLLLAASLHLGCASVGAASPQPGLSEGSTDGTALVGLNLRLSNADEVKIVPQGLGVTTIWIDEVRHDLVFRSDGRRRTLHVATSMLSEELSLDSKGTAATGEAHGSALKLSYSPRIEEVRLFDVREASLDGDLGTLSMPQPGGTFRVCAGCKDSIWCVTGGCVLTPCGWLCDKGKKAPW